MKRALTGRLRDLIRIEQPVAADGFDSAGKGTWTPVAEVWAEVEDTLPRRGEQVTDGIDLVTRAARVTIRYREDIMASMRVTVGRYVREGDGQIWQARRTAQIVSAPAILGRREALVFMIEDYSSAGNAA
ncbi:head-tail adaptor protein [Sphingomonas ginkgonis]|uniref:phage head completion protein n=1 Tax=Sphingomonas ginkgonis TaxID=2315330 RepID=UPI001EF0856A|nr:head-tail adaptor protein [Sphingomonas ginkgonis]